MRSPETYLVLVLGILLFLFVSLGSVPLVSAQPSWTVDPDNPIIATFSGAGAIVKDAGGTYHLFYHTSSSPWRINHATMPTLDGTLTNDGANPVVALGGSGAWDEWTTQGIAILKDIENGEALKYSEADLGISGDTTQYYWMFYSGTDPSSISHKIGIARNTSLTGSWTKYTAESPCLVPNIGEWDSNAVGRMGLNVVKDGSTFKMIYQGDKGSPSLSGIGLATSSNLIDWTKSGSNPIIWGPDLTWCPPSNWCSDASVWKKGNTYIVIYYADKRMGRATGTSFTNLTQSSANPIAVATEDWAPDEISDFALFCTATKDYVFYEGEDGSEKTGRMWCDDILTVGGGGGISPSLDITPKNGPIGTQVTFTGSDFTPNAVVNIYYLVNTEWILKISATDGNGGFTSSPYTIDNLHGSDIQFIALDQNTWIWSNVVHFVVTGEPTPHIEISPTTGSTNVVVTITGTFFTPNCSVSIFNQGMRFDYRAADSDGKFTTFFTIPANTPLGQSQFIAYDHVSDRFSNETFYTITSQQGINPVLSISPTAGRDNIPITFTGSGFTLSALVQIATRDSTGLIVTIGARFADNTGAFEVDINPWSVLGIAGGGHYLNFHALDVATGVMSNEVIFTRTGVLPSEGPAGSLVDLFLPFTGGDVATAGYLVGTFFFVTPLTIIGLAVVAAAKARQYAGLTVFGFFLLSVFICVMTSLYPWWFLVTIIAIVSLVFARGWFGRE